MKKDGLTYLLSYNHYHAINTNIFAHCVVRHNISFLQHHQPTRSLHLSSSHQLSVPRHNFWILCFSVFRSKSLDFITCQHPWISVSSYFQTSSKDFLTFTQPTTSQLPTLPRISSSVRPDSSKTLALFKSCTYLLTYLNTINTTITTTTTTTTTTNTNNSNKSTTKIMTLKPSV